MTRSLFARRLGMAALALAIAGGLGFVLVNSGPLVPIKITVQEVKAGQFTPAIFGVGTVEAKRSWMIGPTSAARVLNVHVDVGDHVKAGQLLAEMDSVDLEQRLKALDATVSRATSTQAAAHAQLADALARRELAAINARRNQDLAAQNFISAGALESRLQEKASADAAVLAAQANSAATGQDILRLQSERAALAQQRTNVRLIAPADALVSTREAEAGSTVVAGQAVLRLIDPSSLWIKLRVDQGRSAGLATGLPASIVLRSQPQNTIAGQVARVEAVADSVTEERIAQVAFGQAPVIGSMLASVGELAEVSLELPQTVSTLLIPNASVQRQQGQTGVWRMKDGAPEFAPVKLGIQSLDGQVQVLQGLQASDTIVVYSQKALSAGAKVKVVDALVGTKPTGKQP
jgi:HlyD family secretion protein